LLIVRIESSIYCHSYFLQLVDGPPEHVLYVTYHFFFSSLFCIFCVGYTAPHHRSSYYEITEGSLKRLCQL